MHMHWISYFGSSGSRIGYISLLFTDFSIPTILPIAVEGYPTSCTPPLHARLFPIQNQPKSQICHLSANASNRATSLKVGRYIEVVMEKLCRTFYAKIINH